MDKIITTNMCFGCGSENPIGLHLDIKCGQGTAAAEWSVTENYVSWDDTLHGGILALIASVFGIINTQYISVLERTQQIGLMKALGMRGKHVAKLFRYEAASIGLLGGVIGAALALKLMPIPLTACTGAHTIFWTSARPGAGRRSTSIMRAACRA